MIRKKFTTPAGTKKRLIPGIDHPFVVPGKDTTLQQMLLGGIFLGSNSGALERTGRTRADVIVDEKAGVLYVPAQARDISGWEPPPGKRAEVGDAFATP
jgi:hypothetical protein